MVTPIHGIIIDGPTEPGPASGMRYTIETNLPQGVVTLSDQVPACERYPDEIIVRPMKFGLAVGGYLVGQVIQWNFRELPDFGECPGAASGGGGMMRDPITGLLVPVIPPNGPPIVSGSGTITGGTPANPPDGGEI